VDKRLNGESELFFGSRLIGPWPFKLDWDFFWARASGGGLRVFAWSGLARSGVRAFDFFRVLGSASFFGVLAASDFFEAKGVVRLFGALGATGFFWVLKAADFVEALGLANFFEPLGASGLFGALEAVRFFGALEATRLFGALEATRLFGALEAVRLFGAFLAVRLFEALGALGFVGALGPASFFGVRVFFSAATLFLAGEALEAGLEAFGAFKPFFFPLAKGVGTFEDLDFLGSKLGSTVIGSPGGV
jgi:hypothetical protein